jgi:hypothetical protein
MMKFLNEAWFWTGFFTVLGSVGSLAAVLIKEHISSKTQIRIERLKLHERECLDAYKKLYSFVTHAGDMMWPPDEPRIDFIAVMKLFTKEVKPNMLLFNTDIRKMLRELETQYACLSDQDLIPEIDFDTFISNRVFKLFEELLKMIENETDKALYKRP